MEKITLRVFRGDSAGGALVDYPGRDVSRHGRAGRHPSDPGGSGLDPGLPLELQGGQVRLVQRGDRRQAEADVQDPRGRSSRRGTITVGPMRAFPLIKDLVTDVSWNYRMAAKIPPLQPQAGSGGQAVQHAADGCGSHSGVPQVHRVLPVPGRLPCHSRARPQGRASSGRARWCASPRWRCTRWTT